MRRAGLRAFLAVSAGIILQQVCHMPAWFLIALLAAALAASFFTRGWSLLLGLLAAAALLLHIQSLPSNDIPWRVRARYEAVVLSEPIPRLGNRTYAVELTRVRIGDRVLPLGLLARLGSGRLLHYGERITFSGALLPFAYPRNPGVVDLNEYYQRQGFAGRMNARSGIVIQDGGHGSPVLRAVVMPVRRHFIDVIGHHFAATNRSLLAGLLLGEKGTLPEETREAFRNAGIMHVLSVSGLHVGILVGVIVILLSVFGLRNLSGLIVLIVATTLYVGIAGFVAPAVRSGVMCVILSLGLFIQRRYDPLNGLCIAGLVILLFSPASLFDVGFQLSFTAALSIILFQPAIRSLFGGLTHHHRLDKWVLSPVSVTAAAGIGTAPLIAYYFYRLPLASFLGNLLVVPLIGFALPWGLLVMITDTFSHGVALFLSLPLDHLLSSITRLTEIIGGFSWSAPVVGRPSLLLVVWLSSLILLAFFALTRKWARKALLFAAAAGAGVWVWSGALQPDHLRVTFLDTLRGDATFVEFPDGRRMLIDAGSENDFWLTPFLRSRGVSRLDLLAITHPDRHVCDGVENLTDLIPVRTCLVPIDSSGKPEYDSLIRDLKRRGTQVVTVGKGDRLPAAGNSLTTAPRSPTPAFNANLLHPSPLHRRFFTDRALSANDLSLVMRLESQEDTLLLCGDLDNPALAAGLPIQAGWLRAPHQGSIRANSDLLLDSVRPHDVVVSGWSRLKPAFLDRCAARGIRVHNLRADGALTLDLR